MIISAIIFEVCLIAQWIYMKEFGLTENIPTIYIKKRATLWYWLIEIINIYIKNRSSSRTDPRGTPQFKISAFGKISTDLKNFLLDRSDSNHLIGSYEIGSVWPSILLSVVFFLGIGSSGLCELWHGTWKPYQVVCARFFGKTFFPKKIGEMGQKTGQKQFSFLNLKKNFVITFLWSCSALKICIICCVLYKSSI